MRFVTTDFLSDGSSYGRSYVRPAGDTRPPLFRMAKRPFLPSSDKIADNFREVTEQIEKALSEIPYAKLHISEEVNEQTYKRSCIQKWLEAGHKTCPKTQQTLSHTALTPNYVLKNLIAQWCESNGVEMPQNQGSCRNGKSGGYASDCDRAAIDALLHRLSSENMEEQRVAAGELRLLAKRNADNRICIAEAGAISLLVKLLSSSDHRTQEYCIVA